MKRPAYIILALTAFLLVSAQALAEVQTASRFDSWPKHLKELKAKTSEASMNEAFTWEMLKEFQDEAQKSGNQDCISYSYYMVVYYYTATHPQIDSALSTVRYMEEKKMSKKDINSAKDMLIYYYQTSGESVKAVTLCREILNTTDDKLLIADANYNIIQLYQNMNMFRRAADKAKEMCDFSRSITDKEYFHYGLANFYSIVADMLVEAGEDEEALPYLQKCDSTLKHDGMTSPASQSYDMRFVAVTWGKYYIDVDDDANAWKMIDLMRSYNIQPLRGHAFELEAMYYLKHKDYAKAKAAMDSMNSIFDSLGRYFGESRRYLLCADIDKGMGDFKSACGYYAKCASALDSLARQTDEFGTSEYIAQLNLSKALLQKSEYKAKAQRYRLNLVTILLFVALAVFIASVLLIFYLRKANRKLEEAGKMKSAFIRNMSHEILTPLNTIVGFSDLMGTGSGDDKQYADLINESSNRLLSMVDSTIEISDIESSAIDTSPIKVNDCCCAAIEKISGSLPSGIELFYKPSNRDLVIKSNSGRLTEAIYDILNNFVNNSGEGYIEIGYKSEHSTLHLYVKNIGTGLSSDKPRWTIEDLTKSDSANSDSVMRLTLSRAIVEKLGGTISIDATYRGGLKLDIILPVA